MKKTRNKKQVRMRRVIRIMAASTFLVIFLSITSCQRLEKNYSMTLENEEVGEYSAGVSVHDPSIIISKGDYYIFGSHMATAKSNDLVEWETVSEGYTPLNPVYTQFFSGNGIFNYAGAATSVIPTDDGSYHVWAPDVIYNEALGKYMMYSSISSTWNASNIALLFADDIEGPYSYSEAIVYSGFTRSTLESTNVLDYVDSDFALSNYTMSGNSYNFNEFPNAIDPTVFYDEDGKMWMVYGSWSGGIFLLEIDENTGLPIRQPEDEENRVDPYFGKKILGGGHMSIEGPYIHYDSETNYYYLFVSYGGLARDGGYQIRVYRSRDVDGDYVDMSGAFPLQGDAQSLFGLKITGNYILPSLEDAYMAPGHNSVVYDDSEDRLLNVFHTRFDNGTEFHEPRVHEMVMNSDSWPVMLPYKVSSQSSEFDLEEKDLSGRYYLVNLGTRIDNYIVEPEIIYLDRNGEFSIENESGEWTYSETDSYFNVTINSVEYKGVAGKTLDEAGNERIFFSVVGNNQSIWAVKE